MQGHQITWASLLSLTIWSCREACTSSSANRLFSLYVAVSSSCSSLLRASAATTCVYKELPQGVLSMLQLPNLAANSARCPLAQHAAGSPSARAKAVATDDCMHASHCAAVRPQDILYSLDTLTCLLSELCAGKEYSRWDGLIRSLSW